MTYPFSHAHQDAGKDLAAASATLKTMRRQYADILSNVGVSDSKVQVLNDGLEWVTEYLLNEVEGCNR